MFSSCYKLGYINQRGADSHRTLVMTEPPLKDTFKEFSFDAVPLDEKEKLSDHALAIPLQDFVDTKVLERPEGVATQV
jgi:hypothetical protein